MNLWLHSGDRLLWTIEGIMVILKIRICDWPLLGVYMCETGRRGKDKEDKWIWGGCN